MKGSVAGGIGKCEWGSSQLKQFHQILNVSYAAFRLLAAYLEGKNFLPTFESGSRKGQ